MAWVGNVCYEIMHMKHLESLNVLLLMCLYILYMYECKINPEGCIVSKVMQ